MTRLWLSAFVLGVLAFAILSGCGPGQVTTAGPLISETGAVSSRDGMTQIYVPAGKFKMGTANHLDEEPIHSVYLNAYWIDQTEVTNAMYEQCVDESQCQPPASVSSYTRKQYYGNAEYGNYPVIYVTWDDASQYCEWAGRHLPTEAQWEKSARGTDGRTYPWGNNTASDGLLNFLFDVGDTSAAGSYSAGASPYGVLDLAGNVWEWVADWYDSIYYSISPESNPSGPPTGTAHVVRGGSWLNHQFLVRSALRIYYKPDSAYFNLGFRCAADAN